MTSTETINLKKTGFVSCILWETSSFSGTSIIIIFLSQTPSKMHCIEQLLTGFFERLQVVRSIVSLQNLSAVVKERWSFAQLFSRSFSSDGKPFIANIMTCRFSFMFTEHKPHPFT